MGLYIKNWNLDNWNYLLKWARIGANNAMIGEHTEVEEIPPHGRLIDADALNLDYEVEMADDWKTAHEIANVVKYAPTIIEAEE